MLEAFPSQLRDVAIRSQAEAPRGAGPRVYVVGASIAGSIIASMLARKIGPRVHLIVGGSPEPKRLIDGCSLRRGTIDAIAHGLSAPRELLWDSLGGRAAQFDTLQVRSGKY